MDICRFMPQDIAEATRLADYSWLGEHEGFSLEFGKLMAEYIVRSGYLNADMAFKITENGIMHGCILAGRKQDQYHDYEAWLASILPNMTEKELQRAQDMKAYFDNMSKKTKMQMQSDDLYLSLFISDKAGCGKFLLKAMLDMAKAQGLKNIYLWTDSTCNHTYYDNNNYTLVEKFDNLNLQNSYAHYISYIYKKPI